MVISSSSIVLHGLDMFGYVWICLDMLGYVWICLDSGSTNIRNILPGCLNLHSAEIWNVLLEASNEY